MLLTHLEVKKHFDLVIYNTNTLSPMLTVNGDDVWFGPDYNAEVAWQIVAKYVKMLAATREEPVPEDAR